MLNGSRHITRYESHFINCCSQKEKNKLFDNLETFSEKHMSRSSKMEMVEYVAHEQTFRLPQIVCVSAELRVVFRKIL